jgi:hypothetical protein
MTFRSPSKGDKIEGLAQAELWRNIIALVNERMTQDPERPRAIENGIYSAENNASGLTLKTGQLLQLDGEDIVDADEGEMKLLTGIAFKTKTPVWHSEIDNLFVVYEADMYPDDMQSIKEADVVAVSEFTLVKATDRYAMIDPADPTKLKSSDTGMFKLLFWEDKSQMAVLDLRDGSNLWRYETTSGTTAKLLRLDDDELTAGALITLTDPDGLIRSNGQKGFCKFVGNKFYVISAPPLTPAEICEMLCECDNTTSTGDCENVCGGTAAGTIRVVISGLEDCVHDTGGAAPICDAANVPMGLSQLNGTYELPLPPTYSPTLGAGLTEVEVGFFDFQDGPPECSGCTNAYTLKMSGTWQACHGTGGFQWIGQLRIDNSEAPVIVDTSTWMGEGGTEALPLNIPGCCQGSPARAWASGTVTFSMA